MPLQWQVLSQLGPHLPARLPFPTPLREGSAFLPGPVLCCDPPTAPAARSLMERSLLKDWHTTDTWVNDCASF